MCPHVCGQSAKRASSDAEEGSRGGLRQPMSACLHTSGKTCIRRRPFDGKLKRMKRIESFLSARPRDDDELRTKASRHLASGTHTHAHSSLANMRIEQLFGWLAGKERRGGKSGHSSAARKNSAIFHYAKNRKTDSRRSGEKKNK